MSILTNGGQIVVRSHSMPPASCSFLTKAHAARSEMALLAWYLSLPDASGPRRWTSAGDQVFQSVYWSSVSLPVEKASIRCGSHLVESPWSITWVNTGRSGRGDKHTFDLAPSAKTVRQFVGEDLWYEDA